VRRARRGTVWYLVSGDPTIRPSDQNIRRSGRRVRYDVQVCPQAHRELRAGQRFVVVAHGRADGTVLWCDASGGEPRRWLWAGMAHPPANARVYVYACSAGPRVLRALRRCEALAHSDAVPMPVGNARALVLRYFREVDHLLADRHSSPADWHAHLAEYVNRAYADEVANPSSILGPGLLLMLRRSLGYVDP
jgi:hypothetical protein